MDKLDRSEGVAVVVLVATLGTVLMPLAGEVYVGSAIARSPAVHQHQTSAPSSSFVTPDIALRPARGDADLVAAMAAGDERAAAEFYDRHAPTAMAVAFRLVRERSDAEEVVLAAFMQTWREAARFNATRGSAVGWLLTITRTRALDHLRATGRASRRTGTSLDDVGSDVLAAPERSGHPEFDTEQQDRRRAVASALRTLPEKQRHVIELAFYAGLSQTEIAERLGEPLGTIKTRVRLAMMRLRDSLRPFAEESRS